jgi:hypothetical protein
MLLASPRWEKRLLHFLELSGVGRIMENGEDDEEVRAAGRDGWIIWEDKADMARSQIDWFCVFLRMPGRASGLGWGRTRNNLSLSFLLILFVKGIHTPNFAHSAPMRAKDFLTE